MSLLQTQYQIQQPDINPDYVPSLDYKVIEDLLEQSHIAVQTTQNQLPNDQRQTIAIQDYIDDGHQELVDSNKKFLDLLTLMSSSTTDPIDPIDFESELMINPLLKN